MSDTINFADFKGLADYEGTGPAGLLPVDGKVRADITNITKGESKSGNKTLKFTFSVNDEFNGQKLTGTLYKDMPYTGTRSDNQPNSIGLRDVLRSIGWAQDRIDSMAAAGKSITTDEFIAECKRAKTIYLNVNAREYNGKTTSDVRGFVTPEAFARDTANGTAKTPRYATNGAATTSAATTGATGDFLANLA